MDCPVCGRGDFDGNCTKCGYTQLSALTIKRCGKCDHANNSNSNKCESCGKKL